MTNLDRPLGPSPYDRLPSLPTFLVGSDDLVDGGALPDEQVGDGLRASPQLSWSGAPAGTRSYAVTCFDADAPSPSGIWHWVLLDLPADCTSLPRGASGGDLPGQAFELSNDTGSAGFLGAAPPPGDMAHRYYFAVHALGEESSGLDRSASPNVVGAFLSLNAIGRAVLHATCEREAG